MLPYPAQGDHPDSGMELSSPLFIPLAGGLLTTEPPGMIPDKRDIFKYKNSQKNVSPVFRFSLSYWKWYFIKTM